MEKSNSIKELATALCSFQSEVEKIKKGNLNPFFKSKYASLSDILDVIRQPLTDNGLSFVQFPKGKYCLETMLMHTSGEWLSENYEMEPSKHDPQGAGSVITYQRRYALGAILGLNIDEDDDGNSASLPETKSESKAETKPELTPSSGSWYKAIEFLKGTGTMDQVRTKYRLSKVNEELLKSKVLE